MGILTRLFGKDVTAATTTNGGGQSSAEGGHSITKDRVLAATDSQAISPMNPGNFSSLRSVPVVPDPRYFTQEEMAAIRQLAAEKEVGARQSKKAYRSLARIENSDVVVHRAHRKYQGKVADAELSKKRADAKLARHLHAIRPDYARLGASLEKAEASAEKRIGELRAKVREAMG